MKQLVLILALIAACPVLIAQGHYRTGEGVIRFNASTPLEDIDATNKKVNAIINATSGEMASVLLIRDFQFPRKLMQEHFNENFMESATYPKAFFKGKLGGFSPVALSSVPMPLALEGELTIHNVTRTINTTAKLSKDGKAILFRSEFLVRPEDYDIEVPKILFNKIAEEVRVTVVLELQESGAKDP